MYIFVTMKSKLKIIGFFLLFVGILVPVLGFTSYKVSDKAYQIVLQEKEDEQDYFAILEIEEIGLKRELFAIDSKENDVDQNILVHDMSVFPSNGVSNVILAAHSGVGRNAYFKDLYKLEKFDEIKLYYDGYLWRYEIIKIEYQDKTGILYLLEKDTDMITLITCTKDDSTRQTIYYGVLKNKEKL